jgi:hypothetical protein
MTHWTGSWTGGTSALPYDTASMLGESAILVTLVAGTTCRSACASNSGGGD